MPSAGSPEASVWFEWTSPVTGPVQIHTNGSGFDTILAVLDRVKAGGHLE